MEVDLADDYVYHEITRIRDAYQFPHNKDRQIDNILEFIRFAQALVTEQKIRVITAMCDYARENCRSLLSEYPNFRETMRKKIVSFVDEVDGNEQFVTACNGLLAMIEGLDTEYIKEPDCY